MNVYIAGRGDAEGIARWRVLAALVRAAGHNVTYDWTQDIERERAKGVHDHDLTLEQRRPYADADARGVFDADVFIYDTPHEKSEGAAYEMGAHHMKRDLIASLIPTFPALKLMQPIASICIGPAKCLFASRCDYHVQTNEEALAVLAQINDGDRTGDLVMQMLLKRGTLPGM